MDEQTLLKKQQMRASFNEPITPSETQYGIMYNPKELRSTQRSLDKLSKYIPELHNLVKTIDQYE